MKRLIMTTALAMFAAPALADEPVTKWKYGCEWRQADNGNYLTKVDGGCAHWIALGRAKHDEGQEHVLARDGGPSDPDNGGGDEGPGTDPGDGPGDGGNGGPDKLGKGGGKGKPGKGKGRN